MITKDLQIRGAGMDATVIRAPATLAPGQLGFPTIVEIYDGAAVSMSRLTVAGPGAVCGAVDENGDRYRCCERESRPTARLTSTSATPR